MKRKIAYILIIFTLPIAVLCSSNIVLGKVKPMLEFFHNMYGDTYRLCSLKNYKQKLPTQKICKKSTVKKNIHLYLIGDSYSWKINSSCYNAKYFSNTSWAKPLPEIKDTNAINILIFETTERFTRDRFENIQHFLLGKKYKDVYGNDRKLSYYIKLNIEDNLQSLLFLDPISLFFREQKAKINQQWFGRIDDNVFISTNKKHLYIKETIDSTLVTSAFNFLPNTEIDTMVIQMNTLQNFAKTKGFDDVYISIMPNKVTVIDSVYNQMHYNQMIPKFENHPKLQVKIIPVLSWITANDYYIGDTHWNHNGSNKWTEMVNNIIASKK